MKTKGAWFFYLSCYWNWKRSYFYVNTFFPPKKRFRCIFLAFTFDHEGIWDQFNRCKPSFDSQEVRAVERRTLLETLASQLPSGTIQFSSKLEAIQRTDQDEVKLELVDGTQLIAKVIQTSNFKRIDWLNFLLVVSFFWFFGALEILFSAFYHCQTYFTLLIVFTHLYEVTDSSIVSVEFVRPRLIPKGMNGISSMSYQWKI